MVNAAPPAPPRTPLIAEIQPQASLFRTQALEHLLEEEDVREPLRVSPPWTWSLFCVLAAVLLTALLGMLFGKVEVQDTGRGVLRPVAGVRLLQAQVAGVLAETCARSGDTVLENQLIARIASAPIQGALLESERQLQLQRQQGQVYTERDERLVQEQVQAVQNKLAQQEALVTSYEKSLQLQEKKVGAMHRLLAEQLVASMNLDEAQEQLNGAQRMLEGARQQQVQLRQELSSLQSQRQRSQWQRLQELSGSQFKREALDSSLGQTRILAPVDGFLEALVARPGDLVQAGQTLAKIVPIDSPLCVVAFLPEKDRGFVKPGDPLLLELAAYPFTEFGTLKGRVVRIGTDLASNYEVQEAFGEAGKLDAPAYRVEIELRPERTARLSGVKIRPGMLLQTRFTLRRQRLITVLLEPLHRWLD